MNDIAKNTLKAFELYRFSSSNKTNILALLQADVDVHETDKFQRTLLHWAASCQGHLEMCKELLARGADIHTSDEKGYKPLHFAAKEGHVEICKLLLKNGADINARDTQGETPLHLAAGWRCAEITQYLLARGANIWVQNNNGETALVWDERYLLTPHRDEWVKKLEAVKAGDCSKIKTAEHIYHLASVMQPSNLHDIPHPKEFIRTLFKQYISHNAKFDHLYEAIFAAPRPPAFDLHTARKEAAKWQGFAL